MFERPNLVNEAIRTYGLVDNIYRNKRQEQEHTEDRQRQEEDRQMRNSMLRKQDMRSDIAFNQQQSVLRDQKNARILTAARAGVASGLPLDEQTLAILGPDAAQYLDENVRAAHKPLLTDATRRLEAGELDQPFLVNYANTIYANQINRGTGGVNKRLSLLAPAGDGESLFAGLEVDQEDGTVAKKMMTENRGTIEEGDVNPKKIPVKTLVQDNIKRQIVIDEFDKAGITRESMDPQKVHQAMAMIDRKLIALGDPMAIQRAQASQNVGQLQAIIAALPENATPQQKQQAILMGGAKLGMDPGQLKAIAEAYGKEKEWTNFDDAQGRVFAVNKHDPNEKVTLSYAVKPPTGGSGGEDGKLDAHQYATLQSTILKGLLPQYPIEEGDFAVGEDGAKRVDFDRYFNRLPRDAQAKATRALMNGERMMRKGYGPIEAAQQSLGQIDYGAINTNEKAWVEAMDEATAAVADRDSAWNVGHLFKSEKELYPEGGKEQAIKMEAEKIYKKKKGIPLQGGPSPQVNSSLTAGNPQGLIKQGNIDLTKRPVVKNSDGSISTVRSIGVSVDGGKVLVIPTVSPDGKILSNKDAVALYRKTGQHLGLFANQQAADNYAQNLHKQQEQMYVKKTAPPAAIAALKANPSRKAEFKAYYGYLPEGF